MTRQKNRRHIWPKSATQSYHPQVLLSANQRNPAVNTEAFGKRPALKKTWVPRTGNHMNSSKQQWKSALEVTCWRGSALRRVWGDCPDDAPHWNFLVCSLPYVGTGSNYLSCPVHASAACLTPSSFWRLPGEKVCNCLSSRGSNSRVKNSHTQILELSRSFSQVFLLLFWASTVVTAGPGLWYCTSGWEWQEIFRMDCEVITAPSQNEGKQSLSSYSDTVICYLPVLYKTIFSFMSGS